MRLNTAIYDVTCQPLYRPVAVSTIPLHASTHSNCSLEESFEYRVFESFSNLSRISSQYTLYQSLLTAVHQWKVCLKLKISINTFQFKRLSVDSTIKSLIKWILWSVAVKRVVNDGWIKYIFDSIFLDLLII